MRTWTAARQRSHSAVLPRHGVMTRYRHGRGGQKSPCGASSRDGPMDRDGLGPALARRRRAVLRPRSGTLVVPLTTSRFIAESRQQVAGRYEGGIARGRWGGLDRRVRGPCRSQSCPACLPALFEWSSYSWIPTIHVSDSAFEAWVEDEDQGSARAMLRPVAHPAARAHPPSIAPLQSTLFLGFLPLIQPRRPASGGCQKASSPVHWQAPWRTQHTP